ncbi:SGNH/GDSL hydrolase family protein [Paenarthrobacter nitroguajacolicus]|uniref:SGNH/GDSL hydrolase family protein n=1 Tax=Paenarthrobacter nitroguajacolicus TaxID=211146 RepID=UPI0040545E1A
MGGLVAVGDSIVNGHGDSMAGVPALGWPQWLADSMGFSYTRYGLGGATSSVIVEKMLPLVQKQYAVGVFNMGTNDALGKWDAALFEQNFGLTAETLSAHCGHVLALTVPASKVATSIVRELGAELGILVVDADVRGHRLLKPDGIHPTALGHLEIADRAAALLGAPLPSVLARNAGRGSVGVKYVTGHAAGRAFTAAKRVVRTMVR